MSLSSLRFGAPKTGKAGIVFGRRGGGIFLGRKGGVSCGEDSGLFVTAYKSAKKDGFTSFC